MGSTNLQQFNPNQANQESDVAYTADSSRANGIVAGPSIFDSALANKLFYQLTTFMAAFANMMAAKGYTLSDANLTTLQGVLSAVLNRPDLYAQDTGTANAYVIALNPAPVGPEIGVPYTILAANANTGAATLTVNTMPPANITTPQGTALQTGAINPNQLIMVAWDGVEYQLISSGLGGGSVPSVPSLSSPANGATGQSQDPTLTWLRSVNVITYELQVASESSFVAGSLIYDQAGLSSTSQSIGNILAENTLYYWRVRAANGSVVSAWSTIWDFTTGSGGGGVPAQPVGIAPANGATGVGLSPTMSWQPVPGATSYSLEVENLGTYQTMYLQAGLTGTSQNIGNILQPNTVYQWEVYAWNAVGEGPAFAANFTTTV
jgi:hypothetical protein